MVMSSQRPADGESDESADSPAESRTEPHDAEWPDTGDLTADELFELLSSPGNRFVIAYLLDSDEAVPWSDLVEHVVEHTDPPLGLSQSTFRGRISTQLISRSLPELAEAGLVEYSEGRYHVRPTERLRLAVPYLDLAREQFPTATDRPVIES
jgi:DNA-binding transcriptional ArsR family regulator